MTGQNLPAPHSSDRAQPLLSVVVPMYNESESIVEFARQLRLALKTVPGAYEVLFIDDGSVDDSVSLVTTIGWPEARIISFIANSGHMAALDAGYRASAGRFVVSLDADLQHPPTLIPQMLSTAIEFGVDVVYAKRLSRDKDSFLKRTSAILYYKLMRSLTEVDVQTSAADFRLVSQRIIEVIRGLPAGQQVFRLLIPSLGFSSQTLDYSAAERFAGETKYSVEKMWNLSTSSIVAFTIKPLTISIRLGLIVSMMAVLGFVYVIVTFFQGAALAGWASVLSTVLLMFGLLFVILGVIGLYIGTILQTLMARPSYIVDRAGEERLRQVGTAPVAKN